MFIDYEGVRINASDLIQRMENLKFLSERVSHYSKNPESLVVKAKLSNWTHKWDPKDDAMLLVGIHKHGWGQWEVIISDRSLRLRRIPSPDLKRRAEYLLKALRTTPKSERESHKSNSRHRRGKETTETEVKESKSERSRETKSRGRKEEDSKRERERKVKEYEDYYWKKVWTP